MAVKIVPASHSSYPRIGEAPEQQAYARAVVEWERGLHTADDLRDAGQALIREVVHEQAEAGLEVVTDGTVRWYDPVTRFSGSIKGLKPGSLVRWFDTSFYARAATITGKIEWSESATADDYEFAVGVTDKTVRPVITGPYTLARYTERDRHGALAPAEASYSSMAELAGDWARAMAEELRSLSKAGARWVQVDEPAILRYPEDFITLRSCLEILADRKGSTKVLLSTFFGNAIPLYRDMLTLPVDALGLDLVSAPLLVDRIAADGSEKPLALGLVDGRNTRLERPEDIAAILDRLLPGLPDSTSWLTSSCGLDFLPRNAARAKCRVLAQAVRMVGASVPPAPVSDVPAEAPQAGEGA